MNKSKYKILGVCLFLPFFLSGCSALELGALALAVKESITAMLFLAFVGIQAFFFIVGLLSILKNTVSSKRGTNAVTRYTRGVVYSMKLKSTIWLHTIVTALCCVGGWFVFEWKGLLFGIPTLLIVILAIVLLIKDTKSGQRVKDTRVLTKASLDVTAQTGSAVGAVVGTAMGGPTGTVIGQSVGNVASSIAANASVNMTVEDAAHIDVSDAVPAIERLANPQLFLSQAQRIGIPTEGRSVDDIVDEVIKYAPASRKEQLKQGKSKEEVAMEILNAYQ